MPWFSNEELPVKEPAPLPNYSIGEEISASAPIAIAWSPPGLAKHRRCALGALTANLVLSIWSADGKPQEGSSWDRRLVVNNALAEYFKTNATDEPGYVASDPKERMRLKTRIRAFTWAPALPTSGSSCTLGTRLSYGKHMVAVCNEDNQLAIAVIESPTSTLGAEQAWNAEVLTHMSLTTVYESIFTEPLCFEDMMKQQRHISHVSWSPWVARGAWYYAVIVYATNEDVRARVVMYNGTDVGLGDEVVYPDIEMRFSGLMKWSPVIETGDVLTLALFAASGLFHLKISPIDASIIERTTHDLDGRWDQTSGSIWDVAHRSTPRLHFSSLLSTIQSPTSILEASPNGLNPLGSHSWRDQIESSAVLFSVKNDLKGNSKVKVWGMATSPLGEFIATCHSVHPSDMIEYGSPNDRRGTITINALPHYRDIRNSFPAQDVSAEGVLFTLKKLVEHAIEGSHQTSAFADEMVRKLFQAYDPTLTPANGNGTSPLSFDVADLNALIDNFKRTAFLDKLTLEDRYTILVSHACKTTSSNDLPRTLITVRLAMALQDLPQALSQTSFSAEILAHHHQLISLIDDLISPREDEGELQSQEQQATSHITTVTPDITTSTIDHCDFCAAPIPFTDLMTATCTSGHAFPRCGLSFLAIQAPGITKYCGICSTPFLSEEFVQLQEEVEEEKGPEPNGDTDMEDVRPKGLLSEEVRTNENETEKVDEDGDGNPGEPVLGEVQINSEEGDEVGENADASGNHQVENEQNGVQIPEPPEEVPEALSGEENNELPITLARVLFLACDACIYCGGKFVG